MIFKLYLGEKVVESIFLKQRRILFLMKMLHDYFKVTSQYDLYENEIYVFDTYKRKVNFNYKSLV